MSGRGRERNTSVDIDLDEEEIAVEVVETERRRFTDLYNDGEIRLWEDKVGWNGYILEDGQHYRVNTRHDSDEYETKVAVDPADVVESIRDHVKDPVAGDAGRFVRRCSPPC